MTHEESIQFKILERLTKSNETVFEVSEYSKLTEGIVGASLYGIIFKGMESRGYVSFSGGYLTYRIYSLESSIYGYRQGSL